jgi:hypothetical protein
MVEGQVSLDTKKERLYSGKFEITHFELTRDSATEPASLGQGRWDLVESHLLKSVLTTNFNR